MFICVEATIQGFKDKSYTDKEIEVILRRSRSVEVKYYEILLVKQSFVKK